MNREAVEFVNAVMSNPPDRVTACDGWTNHELLAHLAAGGAELGAIVGAHLEGAPIPPTTPFEVREAVFRSMADGDLRRAYLAGGAGLTNALAEMLRRNPTATVPFTGWEMDGATLITHIRSELAIHRWDLVGDDDISFDLLSQPELTRHAVRALHQFVGLRESPSARARFAVTPEGFSVRIRTTEHQPDVLCSVDGGQGTFHLVDPDDTPALTLDPAGRLLMLWGRRPSAAHHMSSDLPPADLATLQAWLYAR